MGRKTVQHKDSITSAILQKIRMRKDRKAALSNSRIRTAAQEEYMAAHREVNRNIRADEKGTLTTCQDKQNNL